MVDRIDYDEFGLFHENAEEYGLPFDGPPAVSRAFVEVAPGRMVSALVWSEGEPDLLAKLWRWLTRPPSPPMDRR